MSAKDVRNIVLLGHGGSGKTKLAENMLAMVGAPAQLDYDAEEKKRGISISLATAPAT